jgi:hypothetical protein
MSSDRLSTQKIEDPQSTQPGALILDLMKIKPFQLDLKISSGTQAKSEIGPTIAAAARLAPDPGGEAGRISKEIQDHQNRALAAVRELHDRSKKHTDAEYEQSRKLAQKELRKAIDTADSSHGRALQLADEFNKLKEPTRQALAKELNLDPTKVSQDDIDRKLHLRTLTPEQRSKLESLAELQKESHTIQQLKETPAITRTQAAFLKANGDMEAAPSASPEEKQRVRQQNAADALTLLREAVISESSSGSPQELIHSKAFKTASGVVFERYKDYQQELEEQTHGAYGRANALVGQGKYEEALPLMAKLQADVPALKTDQQFQDRLLEAYAGPSDGDLNKHAQAFHEIYFQQENHELSKEEKTKKYSAALFELDKSAELYGKRGEQITKGLRSLEDEQRKLEFDLKNLDTRNLEQAEKKSETERLTREVDSVKEQMEIVNKGLASNKTNIADIAYWQGSCRYQVGDLSEAHERFSFAKENDSTYATLPAFKLDELAHATNWWSRHNWVKQAGITIAGVAAGIVVGALLSETGPGGVIAGYATAAGIIDAASVGTVAIAVNSTIWGAAAGSLATAGTTKAFGDPVTAGTFVRGAGAGAGGAAFNLARLAFAPSVLAGTVPRVVAGMGSGMTYGVVDGSANLIADEAFDNVPTGTAFKNFGTNVAWSTGLGAFTPIRAFRPMSIGETAVTNVWKERVISSLAGSAPVLIQPTLEGAIMQVPFSAWDDLKHQPITPRHDRSVQKHDFSKDEDVIEELADPTVKGPKKH